MKTTLDGLFGQTLRNHRESAGLSRNQLAGLVGLDGSYVYRLEMGNRRPGRETVLAMADALELDGDTVNKWLIAAGHGPIPLLPEVAPAVPSRSGKIGRRALAGSSPKSNAARWGARLEKMGIEEPVFVRLMKGMETAGVRERQRIAAIVSETLRRVTNSLEASVHTAVIPAAGDKHRSVASHVMQRLLIRAIGEAAECGIHEIILVLAPGMVESFYTPLKELIEVAVAPLIKLRYCVQDKPYGLGDALLRAAGDVGQHPFAVLLPDDVLNTGPSRITKVRELSLMIDALAKLDGASLVAVTTVSKRKRPHYGIVEVSPAPAVNNTLQINKLIEKPHASHSIVSSQHALSIVGRYLLQPDIFGVLGELRKQGQHPLELTAALEILRETKREIRAFPLKGARRDFGEVLWQANEVIESSYKTSSGIRGI